ncbi:MAG TPA: uroporphyrinogen-III synthase [Acidimicrobiales bacterium]|jgi:uroporphyrinogen-III synthase|nr:uroporphyrinogen-III synthase [Acidimicrobiales bacterium]
MSLRALEGFVVGVTADRRWTEQAELLQRRGASVLHGPTIKTEYLASDEALRSATHAVIARRPDYLVATTGIGVRAWLEAAQAWGLAESLLEALADTRVAARGPKASAAVHTAGLSVWDSPASERLEDVVARLQAEPLAGRAVAFQHYGERNHAAVDALFGHGADVIEVPIYRWQRPDDDGPALRLVEAVCDGRLDAVTFTSAPAVHNLLAVARDHGRDAALVDAFNRRGVVAACIGPVCAEGARREGVDLPIAPAHGRLGLLVRALTDALQTRRQALVLAGRPVVVQGRALVVDGQAVDMPNRERAVFEALVRRRGAVVSKTALLRMLGDDEAGGHALEATIGRLRRRLGPAGGAVRSVRGRGYVLDAEPG